MNTDTGVVSLIRSSKQRADSGLYALVVELTDQQPDELVVQKTRAYVFVALTNGQEASSVSSLEISRLREILNVTKLNEDVSSSTSTSNNVAVVVSTDDYYDYSSSGEEEAKSNVDFRLDRVMKQLKAANIRLNKKKTMGGSGVQRVVESSSGRLGKLKNQLLNSINYPNFLPLLAIVVFSCVALAVVFASLCMLGSYYKRRRLNSADDLSSSSKSPKHAGSSYHHQVYSDSSYYDKALGLDKDMVVTSSSSAGSTSSHHNSPNSGSGGCGIQQQTSHHTAATETTTASSASSASPMSLVSAELLVDARAGDLVDCGSPSARRIVVKKRTGNITNSSGHTTSTFMSTIDKSKLL